MVGGELHGAGVRLGADLLVALTNTSVALAGATVVAPAGFVGTVQGRPPEIFVPITTIPANLDQSLLDEVIRIGSELLGGLRVVHDLGHGASHQHPAVMQDHGPVADDEYLFAQLGSPLLHGLFQHHIAVLELPVHEPHFQHVVDTCLDFDQIKRFADEAFCPGLKRP